MKVTALIPDRLIHEVQTNAKGKNLTESLVKALAEWNDLQKIRRLNQLVDTHPLKFSRGFSPSRTRAINRKP